MDVQFIIESFFCMLGRFDFDRAKVYIDGKKEVLQKLAPTFPNQYQLMAMLTTFSHLAEVEKNYHNQPFPVNQSQSHHSFLPTTNFLRKTKTLREMYNDIFSELQQLEQLESNAVTSKKTKNDLSPSSTKSYILTSLNDNVNTSSSQHHSPGQSSHTQQTLAKLHNKQSGGSTSSGDQQSSNSSSTDKDSPVTHVPQSPSTAFRNSFFKVLSPVSGSTIQSPNNSFSNHNPYSSSSGSGIDAPPNSTNTTPVTNTLNMREFSEKLISHFCMQLQAFVQARLDMIDVYEKLTEELGMKVASVDGIAFRLSMLCRQYHKYFHHPLLAPIKEGMTLECESLMTLIRATIDIQHWRFLPSLFDLQEAQSKLNYWAASTFNKEATKRRFKVSKTQTAPRLYEWLCKFREFLGAKFTLYFHAILSKSFPPNNFKSSCSRLSIDYYAKLSSFQRKVDAVFIALMYDVSNEKDFRGIGYQYPSRDCQQPQGKNTLQPMIVIPAESKTKLNSLQAEIYMTAMTNQQVMMKGLYQFHDNIKKLTYSMTKPDFNVVLVIVCDGQRSDRDSNVRGFTQEISNLFSFSNIFPT